MARGGSDSVRELILRFNAQTELARREIRELADKLERDTHRMERDMLGLDRTMDRVGRGFKRVGGMIAGAIAVGSVVAAGRAMLQYAEAAKQLEAQLRLATDRSGNFLQSQRDVRRIAEATRSDINEVGALYAGFMRNSAELGISQMQAARAVQTVTEAFTISGSSAEEAANGTRQLMQAFQSGTLRGDEFNSMMENAPRLARLLADSLGKPVGALRAMAEAGQLTADTLTTAFTDGRFTAALDREFRAMPVTFDQAMTLLNNSAQETFGAFDQGGQFSNALADFLTRGSNGMSDLATEAAEAGVSIRATIDGLSDAWDPFGASAEGVFDWIAQDFRDTTLEILDFIDEIDRAWQGVKQGMTPEGRTQQWMDWWNQESPPQVTGDNVTFSDGTTRRLTADEDRALDRGENPWASTPNTRGGRARAAIRESEREGQIRLDVIGLGGTTRNGQDFGPSGMQRWLADPTRYDLFGNLIAPRANRPAAASSGSGSRRTRQPRQNNNWRSREEAIGYLGRTFEAQGLRVGENNQFGGVQGNHPGMGNAAHGLYAIDVNAIGGRDASNPEARARLDIAAREAQAMGFKVLWNGQVYEPGGSGPAGAIPRGQNQHTDHLHAQAPQGITGERRREFDASRAAEQQWRREERYGQQVEQAQRRLLDARGALITGAEERAQFERALIETERRSEDARIESQMIQGEITEAQAEQLRLINNATAAAERERVDREEADRIQREALDLRRSDLQNEMDLQSASASLLEGREAQRDAALRLLRLQIEAERIELEGIIASRDSTEAQKEIARRRLAILGGLQEMGERGINRQYESPSERYMRELRGAGDSLDDRFEEIAVSGLDALNEGLVDAIMGAKSLGDVFHDIANQIIADLLRIAIQQLILKPLMEMLGGVGGGGGGGFGSLLGGLFGGGREAGGSVYPGKAYLVGEKRPELFVPHTSGVIVPRLPKIMVPKRNGGGVNLTFAPVISAPGADATQLRQVSAELAAMRQSFPGKVLEVVKDARDRRVF